MEIFYSYKLYSEFIKGSKLLISTCLEDFSAYL
jgi:hypothetical protein